jgi:hypothetical protein
MKKLVLLSFALMTSAVVFTSCKKDYTCTCTDSSGFSASVTIHTTKKKATDACTADASVYGSGVTCAIK